MKALISAASTALAYKLQRLLDQEIEFVYADQVDMPQFLLRKKQFVKIPDGNSPTFAHQLLALCLDNQVDWVFPLRKNELQALAESCQLFKEYGIQIIVPSVESVKKLLMADSKNGNVFVVMDKEFIVKPDSSDINPKQFENGVYTVNPQNNIQYAIYTAD